MGPARVRLIGGPTMQRQLLNPHAVTTTGQPQSLPQGPARDTEAEGEKEKLRGPEKDGETSKKNTWKS